METYSLDEWTLTLGTGLREKFIMQCSAVQRIAVQCKWAHVPSPLCSRQKHLWRFLLGHGTQAKCKVSVETPRKSETLERDACAKGNEPKEPLEPCELVSGVFA